jgi:hypothetical protein
MTLRLRTPTEPQRRRRAVLPALLITLAVAALGVAAPAALAHESEQYTLPAGRDFADLGPRLSQQFLSAIGNAVSATNAAIDAALAAGERPEQLQTLQSADHVAQQVWAWLFAAFPTNELLDLGLLSADTRAQYPGLLTMYRPVESIYDDPLLLLDLSKPVRTLFRAGTISAAGVLFGTDKVIHFINVGRIYHGHYLEALGRGLSAAQATQHAVQATNKNPLLSEDGVLGLLSTGIRSNADLAANFAGLSFYRNLTEPVQLGGAMLPPMLQRDGAHWRVTVRDDATVFSRFVTPHWNEVLNPNSYLGYVGRRVREIIATRCGDVADWYRDGRGRPLGSAWFAARQRELATLDGQPYGHQLPADHPVGVADICRNAGGNSAAARADAALRWGGALPAAQGPKLQRSALWRAAAAGRNEEVERLTAADAALDQADIDGDTPLLAALRQGQLQAASLLIARGADAGRPAAHGVTPLLLAASGGHAALAEQLLQAGADPNARDRFGRTALQEAARRGDLSVAAVLLRHGADATLASNAGTDALQWAQYAGHDDLLAALRASPAAAGKSAPRARQAQTKAGGADAAAAPPPLH